MSQDKIFPNGARFVAKRENAPDFVKGSIWVQSVSDFIQFLTDHQKDNQLTLKLLKSKNTGKIYLELDTYKPASKPNYIPPADSAAEDEYEREIQVKDIPF